MFRIMTEEIVVAENEAVKIARTWIEAWNRRDLDGIMACYADDVVLTSPLVVSVLGDRTGTIRGKEALRAHLRKALIVFPGLKLELLRVFAGVVSLVIHYRGLHGRIVADVMMVNPDGQINMVMSHTTVGV